MKGKVKWFSNTRGFGFIVSEETSGDIFVHHSQIIMEGYRKLKSNQEVEFDLVESSTQKQAHKVTLLNKG